MAGSLLLENGSALLLQTGGVLNLEVSGDPAALLLLHMDGSNGSQVFLDATGRHGILTNTNAQVETADNVFGTGAGSFDNAWDSSLQITGNLNDFAFGTNDFTIEFRIKHDSSQTDYFGVFNTAGDSAQSYSGAFQLFGLSNYLMLFYSGGYVDAFAYTEDTWQAICMVRQGNSIKCYVDGTLVRTMSVTGHSYTRAAPWIGRFVPANTTRNFKGKLDEFRISSTARQTANYTPAVVAFTPADPTTSLIDSFSESGSTTIGKIWSDGWCAGQAFNVVSAKTATTAKFYIKRTGSPGGSITYKFYASTGTVGTNATGTGSALATSGVIPASNISTSSSLVEFTLPYSLSAGDIVLVIEYAGATGDASNCIEIGGVMSSGGHAGNFCYKDGGGWASLGWDCSFYLYGF